MKTRPFFRDDCSHQQNLKPDWQPFGLGKGQPKAFSQSGEKAEIEHKKHLKKKTQKSIFRTHANTCGGFTVFTVCMLQSCWFLWQVFLHEPEFTSSESRSGVRILDEGFSESYPVTSAAASQNNNEMQVVTVSAIISNIATS